MPCSLLLTRHRFVRCIMSTTFAWALWLYCLLTLVIWPLSLGTTAPLLEDLIHVGIASLSSELPETYQSSARGTFPNLFPIEPFRIPQPLLCLFIVTWFAGQSSFGHNRRYSILVFQATSYCKTPPHFLNYIFIRPIAFSLHFTGYLGWSPVSDLRFGLGHIPAICVMPQRRSFQRVKAVRIRTMCTLKLHCLLNKTSRVEYSMKTWPWTLSWDN